jgi:uncharacterized protein YecE (DUF72 family)
MHRMSISNATIRTGTAGWSIPSASKPLFPEQGSHLQRYARTFGCAEINSSFYKSHQASTYAAWAAQTPESFRFSAKLPQTITHAQRLRRVRKQLEQFLGEVAGLEQRLSVLLVQLPPSLAFEARAVGNFFELFRALHSGAIVCEPRHASWFTSSAEKLMTEWHICRAAADPARFAGADACGAWPEVYYHRWHGSPRMYWSHYSTEWIELQSAAALTLPGTAERWFVFDNTAGGGAIPNAWQFQASCRILNKPA